MVSHNLKSKIGMSINNYEYLTDLVQRIFAFTISVFTCSIIIL